MNMVIDLSELTPGAFVDANSHLFDWKRVANLFGSGR